VEASGTGQTVVQYRLCCWGLSILMYCPGQLPGRSSVISGELQAGGIVYVYVWRECSYDPPKGQSGQLVHTFVNHILMTSCTYISTFSVCCYSRYLSRWISVYHLLLFFLFDLSICYKVFGDGPEWNQQGFLTGDPSERECVRRWYFFWRFFM
jgi:hypothetical protein